MTPEQLFQDAIRRFEQGDHAGAERCCDALLEARPLHPNGLLFRAYLRLERNAAELALVDVDHLLGVAPAHGEAWGKRGSALLRLGRVGEAGPCFVKALSLNKNLVEAHLGLAVVHLKSGHPADALPCAEQALARSPLDPEARTLRASALLELHRPEQALAEADRVLATNPRHPGANLNRGNALLALDDPRGALAAYGLAETTQPGNAQIAVNQALALQALERSEDALAALDRALAIDPEEPTARTCRGFLHLLLGRFEAGWSDYEARWRRPDLAPMRREFGRPLWRGEPLEGRTILLHAEQGYGDTIQFARYIPLVARTAKVILEVQTALVPLFVDLPGVSVLCVEGEPIPPFDFHCPLGSLPRRFGTDLDSIPGEVPYLRPRTPTPTLAPARSSPARPRVGFVWAGNPRHANDARRSLSLHQILPLIESPGIAPVSLQPGLGEAELSRLASVPDLEARGSTLRDFGDTAAALGELDLLVSVDTAAAHLAGALGRPVWILLPFVPDWRWLREREDSPWYPSARLFRQPRLGDWPAAIARVREELSRLGRPGRIGPDPDGKEAGPSIP